MTDRYHRRVMQITDLQTRAAGDDSEDHRIVEGILSTDTPYRRWYDGYEILDHGDGVDLSRMEDGQGVALYEHDRMLVIGRVEKITKTKKQLKVRLWIGGSDEADKVIRKLDNGLLKRMSVGYFPDMDSAEVHERKDGLVDVIVKKWQPYEASIVSVPADDRAKLTSVRDALGDEQGNSSLEKLKSQDEGDDAPAEPKPSEVKTDMSEDNTKELEQKAQAEAQERIAGIYALCQEHGMEARAAEFVKDGKSLADVQAVVLSEIAKRKAEDAQKAKAAADKDDEVRNVKTPKAPAVHTKQHKYDLQKALFDPVMSGVEKERHDELVERRGRPAGQTGRLVDAEELARWAMPTLRHRLDPNAARRVDDILTRQITGDGASAGALDPEPYVASAFVELLRSTSLADFMGYTILPGLTGSPKIPAQTGAESFAWTPVDGGTNLAETTNPTFSTHDMEIHTAYSRQGVGRGVIENSVPSIFSLIMSSIVIGAGDLMFRTTLTGSGSDSPVGILNATPSIGSVTGTAPAALSYTNIGPIRGKLRTAHVLKSGAMDNARWLFTGADYSVLEVKQKFSGASGGIISNGMIDNNPAAHYEGLTAATALYGDFTGVYVGLWNEALEFRTSDHENGGVKISSYMDMDCVVTQPTAIVKVSA